MDGTRGLAKDVCGDAAPFAPTPTLFKTRRDAFLHAVDANRGRARSEVWARNASSSAIPRAECDRNDASRREAAKCAAR
jgi:hypothetical protein